MLGEQLGFLRHGAVHAVLDEAGEIGRLINGLANSMSNRS
jgi:hypothetical protein